MIQPSPCCISFLINCTRRILGRPAAVPPSYKDTVVGKYFVGLLVNDAVLVELKAVRALDKVHRLQCVNYLKAAGLHLRLLLNFGNPCLEIKRLAKRL